MPRHQILCSWMSKPPNHVNLIQFHGESQSNPRSLKKHELRCWGFFSLGCPHKSTVQRFPSSLQQSWLQKSTVKSEQDNPWKKEVSIDNQNILAQYNNKTMLFSGPKSLVRYLVGNICLYWSPCSQSHASNSQCRQIYLSFQTVAHVKALVLQTLLWVIHTVSVNNFH